MYRLRKNKFFNPTKKKKKKRRNNIFFMSGLLFQITNVRGIKKEKIKLWWWGCGIRNRKRREMGVSWNSLAVQEGFVALQERQCHLLTYINPCNLLGPFFLFMTSSWPMAITPHRAKFPCDSPAPPIFCYSWPHSLCSAYTCRLYIALMCLCVPSPPFFSCRLGCLFFFFSFFCLFWGVVPVVSFLIMFKQNHTLLLKKKSKHDHYMQKKTIR